MSSDNKIEKIIRLMRNDDSIDAPAGAVRWAENLFAMRAFQPRVSTLRVIIATLISDLLPNKAAFGERSGSASSSRQILLEAEDCGIDLRVQASKHGFTLRGQMLGDGFENAKISLFAGDVQFETRGDDLSSFNIRVTSNLRVKYSAGFVKAPAFVRYN